MKKLLFALLLAGLVAPATAVAAGAQSAAKLKPAPAIKGDPVSLRESVSVNSRMVRLGDLFSGVGDKADITVAYAPEPGKRAVFDARWLFRAARAYGLNWRPLSLQDQVVIERESLTVNREEIEDRIRAAMIERGADADIQVELSNRMMQIHVPGDSTASIAVEDVNWDSRTGRFTAAVAAPAGEPGASRIRVTGRMVRFADVPVLVKRMSVNETISENDVRMTKVRQDRLPRDSITEIHDLVGKAAKVGLRADTPVLHASVQQPILVPKGSIVTIVLQTPRMMLTAQGKALDNGSEGDTIRISNARSNKIVEGEVIGTGRVTVKSADMMALN
jgi:flagella basal body P-ring formation protein FlgA